MPAAKSTGGGSKKAPAQAVKAEKAEAKITPAKAKDKVNAAKAVALKETKSNDKKDAKNAKVAAGKVVGTQPSAPTPTPTPTPTTTPPTTKTAIKASGSSVNKINPDPGYFRPTNRPMPSMPDKFSSIESSGSSSGVKTPTRNITDISSLVPQFDAEYITTILFENLSAIELSKVERHDTIDGINQKYSIISNLSEIREKYDATKQLTIMDKFSPLTSIYNINIEDKIPKDDYILLEGLNTTYQYLDENNKIVNREKGYWYIDTNGDLVIDLINLEQSQQVEIQIDTNGTIYKVDRVE
jgi:hypothetical protein